MGTRLIGLGAGGHAVSVVDAVLSSGLWEIVALLDREPQAFGIDLPVLPDGELERLREEVDHAFVGVGGIEDPGPRVEVFERLRAAGFELPAIVHARASVSPFASVGAGAQLLAGVVVNAGASVGEGAILNTGAIVEHDCRIGAHAHVAPGATLGGEVIVGDRSHVGMGAVVLQGLTVGTGALVAAGAVVTRDVAPATRVAGVPARPLGS